MIGSPLGFNLDRSFDMVHLLNSQAQGRDSELINFLNGVAKRRRHR